MAQNHTDEEGYVPGPPPEDDPLVRVERCTLDPDKLICTTARNDYYPGYVGSDDFPSIMAGVDFTDADREWATAYLEARDMNYEINIIQWSKMRGLIRHLMTHGHWGPFEHPTITFSVRGVSRSLMAQLTRHRVASFDVQSMRYVNFADVDPRPGKGVVSIPELDDPGLCGRNAEFHPYWSDTDDEDILRIRNEIYHNAMRDAFEHYNELLDFGVAPENARMVLPLGTKVNLCFTMNARMLMHVADMRGEADAQWEIRDLTNQVLDLAEEWAPATIGYYREEMQGRKNRLSP